MATIRPLQHHVLLRFALKDGSNIIAPNGGRTPGDIIVEAMGPDVPPGLFDIGDKVLLRGDAKVFGTDQQGGDETFGVVPFQMIMAVVDGEASEQHESPFAQEVAAALDGMAENQPVLATN